MRTSLGIDAGGTSTRCILIDESGTCRGLGRSGPGNPLSATSAVAVASMTEAIAEALSSGGTRPDAVVVTMAGGADATEVSGLAESLAGLGVFAPPRIESDLLSAYFSGRTEPAGYLLLAGTGAVAGRVERGELAAVSDGLGWLLGDEGSGFWLGREGAVAALRGDDGRGPATALTRAFLSFFGGQAAPRIGRSDEVSAAIDTVYRRQRPLDLARFAPAVTELASSDDVARSIVSRAAAALVASWRSVQADGVSGTVLAGGVLSRPGLLRDLVLAEVGEASVVSDGLVGAAVLALRAIGVAADKSVRTRLQASLVGH